MTTDPRGLDLAGRLRAVLVTDDRGDPRRVARIARAARPPGGGMLPAVLVREKSLGADALSRFLREFLRELRGSPPPLVLVNDGGAAVARGPDLGVHLPVDPHRVATVRRSRGRGVCLGMSTHTVEEVRAAAEAGADYVLFGPVGDTPSKRGILEPRGPEGLREAACAVSIPVIAIGGVTRRTAPALGRAGASGGAAIRAFLDVPDPAATTVAFRAAFAGGGRR